MGKEPEQKFKIADKKDYIEQVRLTAEGDLFINIFGKMTPVEELTDYRRPDVSGSTGIWTPSPTARLEINPSGYPDGCIGTEPEVCPLCGKKLTDCACDEAFEEAEPKVLSAEDSYRVKYSHMKNSDDEFAWSDGYVVGYEDGDKNGQLKRDLGYQPFVKAVTEIRIGAKPEAWREYALEALKNIPPLNKD